jgi:hypothetical protein
MLRPAIAAFALMLLMGAWFSTGIQLPVYDLQKALVAEILKAVFFHITPLSSLLGEGLILEGGSYVLSSNHGILPILSLSLAGLLAGALSRSVQQALMAAITSAIFLLLLAIFLLLGFLPPLPGPENMKWQVDNVFAAIFGDRPLDLPTLIAVTALSSLPTGKLMEWLLAERVEEEPLFSWRRRSTVEAG